MRKVWGLIATSLCFAATIAAQSDRGTITGTISDSAGAVVPNASVVAINANTGVQSRTVTTSTGNYTIPSLPVGSYDVSVEAPGFKKFTRQGLKVDVAETARVDATLEVGNASETVTVTAEAPLLKTEDAEQSETFTGDHLNSLPINFGIGGGAIRNPLGFVALAPGTSLNGWNDIKINGAPNGSFRIIFEGQDSTSDLNPRVSDESQPSMESIQEFTLETSNFSPEFGQVTGGLFNFTARSGTNQFHGSAYDYSTNEDLGAGQPFTNSGNGHLLRPKNRQNDFGATVGGPVWIPKVYNGRDKTFFFFSYEGYRKHQATDQFGTVPTPAMRAGDFSSILTGKTLNTDPLNRAILENTIYDPMTARQAPNGQTVTDPFPNNIIPMNRFDPVALKVQNLIPLPTRAGNVNNFEERYTTSKIQAIPTLKIDENFNSKMHLSGYYSQQRTDKDNSQDGFPDPITARRAQFIRSHTVRLNFDYTISPTVIAHLGAGYQKYYNPDTAPPSITGYDSVGLLGLKGAAGPGFPQFQNIGNNSFGGVNEQNGAGNSIGPVNENLYIQHKPTGVASVTVVRGNHSYKAGSEWRLDTFENLNYLGTAGAYGFNPAQTGLPSTNGQNLNGGGVGFAYASFLLGQVNNASIANTQNPQYRKIAWAMFAQDTWRMTRKLTVTYGLRYDYQPAPHELYHRTSEFAPTVANPSAGGLPGATIYEGSGAGRCNCSFTTTYPYAIGPRIGGAYQIDAKTVLRAGWGLTYAQAPNFNYIGGGNSLGMGFNNITFTNPTFGSPVSQLSNGLTYDPNALYAATYAVGIRPDPGQIDNPPALVDRNGGRPPRENQWNISLQREITKDLVVEAAYVANRGVWEQANGLVNLNALTPQRIAQFGLNINNPNDLTLLTSKLSTTAAQTAGFKAPYPSYSLGNTVAQSLRPFPQFGGVGVMWAPLGDSWYDALQVKVTKRFSHGLEGTLNYTRSKNLATAEEQGGSTVPINNVFNRRNQKTYSLNDQPNILVASFTYRIPGWNRTNLTKQILGGWELGGILRYASGTPIAAPTANNSLSSVLFQNTYATRIPGQPLFLKDLNCHCIDPNKDLVLNPAAWAQPPAGQFGQTAVYFNDYRYSRRPDEELSLGRIFRIKESMNFQIRAELFNVFNRTYLNNPSNGNAQATPSYKADGTLASGFGYINPGSVYAAPRTGQIVARFQF